MSRPTVVIIDDDRSFVEAVSIFLERRGYHVVGAFNGKEGLARLRRNGIDLGIIDVHLPDISGIDLAKQIRGAGAAPPVILISGDHSPEVSQACRDAGARRFLPKPIGPTELLNAISDIIEGGT
jgi:two-component system response regulator MtrA